MGMLRPILYLKRKKKHKIKQKHIKNKKKELVKIILLKLLRDV